MKTAHRFIFFIPIVIVVLSINSCFLPAQRSTNSFPPATPETDLFEALPTNVWSSLLKVTPVPHTNPLPEPEGTPLDGMYAKYDPAYPQWWSCRRCADYRPVGGVWRLQFDRGVMRIYYEVTGWNSLASYTVSGDRLHLFNDPYCKEATGEYVWELVNGNLSLDVVDDPCSFQLRGQNLSELSWEGCQAPEDEEGWQAPRGCKDPIVENIEVPKLTGTLKLDVHEGDARKFSDPLDTIVNVSGVGLSSSDGVIHSSSDDSILYGNNRVLWTENDWIEVSIDQPFSSMGVQFLGDYVIGWARVTFDGEEVWRGDTSRIWSAFGRFGGYIEISGYEAGKHTLRVERLNIDSRPVVVAFFGLSK